MNRFLAIIMCILCVTILCACSDNNQSDVDAPTSISENTAHTAQGDSTQIVGTWVCNEVSDDCYFIFDENGDAFAKWGTSTVYGYYDYDEEEGLYDIDIPNFLYNEYKAHFGGDIMTLKSDESSFTFEKAQMPQVIIKAPDNLSIDEEIIGDWQSEDNFECYKFNSDGTATITDMYNYATIDCKFSCNDGVVTMYYMASDTKDGSREVAYSFENDKLILNNYTYEKVTTE
ncbi:MAG: hypothetical protein E7513_03985 [Ruminococcaceae bacterium]|nr:hypothetical protein [Oscillospiraceae bacterium]